MGATRFHRRLAEACLRLAQQNPLLAWRYGLMAQEHLELADSGPGSDPPPQPAAPTDSPPPDGKLGQGEKS